MTTEPNDFPPEFLAAFVDGELGPHDRDRVESWLAEHPEAREILETQESLTRGNSDLWLSLTPPQPSDRQWAATLQAIRDQTRPPAYRKWIALTGVLTLMATAAMVFIVVAASDRPGPLPSPDHLPNVPSGLVVFFDEPFAMANDDEVRIVSLPESAANLLVVGEHPISDAFLLLAKADEVEFFGVGSDVAGRFPEVPSDPMAEEAPVIWTPR